jgi:uncharacterized membrane protein
VTAEPGNPPHALERVIFFSDAVVAIAITLVALPLVDQARELGGRSAGGFVQDNATGLIAAGISFLVIAAFWRDHHRLFARATGYTRAVIQANFGWLLGVTALPVVTVVDVGSSQDDRGALALYLGTIVYLMIMVRIEEVLLAARGLLGDERLSPRFLVRLALPVVLALIALVITQLRPSWNLWPLLLLLLARPLWSLVDRRRSTS